MRLHHHNSESGAQTFTLGLILTISWCTPSSLALFRATIAHLNLPCTFVIQLVSTFTQSCTTLVSENQY